MTPTRLAELERQRALVRSHLEWLDTEIARATSAPTAPAAPATEPVSAATPAIEPLGVTPPPDPVSSALAARRGCFLYAGAVALLGLLMFGALYFSRYRDHSLFFVSTPAAADKKLSPPPPTSTVPRK